MQKTASDSEKQNQTQSLHEEEVFENVHYNIDVPGNVLVENCFNKASSKLRKLFGFQVGSSSKGSLGLIFPELTPSFARLVFRYTSLAIGGKQFLSNPLSTGNDYFTRLSEFTNVFDMNRILNETEINAIVVGCGFMTHITTKNDWYPGVIGGLQTIAETNLFQDSIPRSKCTLKIVLRWLKGNKTFEPKPDNIEPPPTNLSLTETPGLEKSDDNSSVAEIVSSTSSIIAQIKVILCSFIIDVEAAKLFGILCEAFRHLLRPEDMRSSLREAQCFSLASYLNNESSKGIEFYSKKLSNNPKNPQLLRILEALHNRKKDTNGFTYANPFSGVLYLKLLSANISHRGQKYGFFTKKKVKRALLSEKNKQQEKTSKSSIYLNNASLHLCCHVRLSGVTDKSTPAHLKRRTRYGMQTGSEYRWDLPMAILMPHSSGSAISDIAIVEHSNVNEDKNAFHHHPNKVSQVPLQISVYGKGNLASKCFGKVVSKDYSTKLHVSELSLNHKKSGAPIEGSRITFLTQFFPFSENFFSDRIPTVYETLLSLLTAHEHSQALLAKNNGYVYRNCFSLSGESDNIIKTFRERFPFHDNFVDICRLGTYAKLFCSIVYIGEIPFVRSLVINLKNMKDTLKSNELEMFNQATKKLKDAVSMWLTNFTFLNLNSKECEELVHLYVALSSKPNHELSKSFNRMYRNALSIFLFGHEYSDIGSNFSHIKTLNITEIRHTLMKINQFLPLVNVKVPEIVDTKKWAYKFIVQLFKIYVPICLSQFKTVSSSGEITFNTSLARECIDLFRSISNLLSSIRDDFPQLTYGLTFGTLFEPHMLEWISCCSEQYLEWAKTISSILKWKCTIVEKSLLTEAILASIPPCFIFLNSFVWLGSFESAIAVHKKIIQQIALVLNNHIFFLKERAKAIGESLDQEKKANVFAFDVVIDRENRKLHTTNPNELNNEEHEVFHTWKKIRLCIADLCICASACQSLAIRSKESLMSIFTEEINKTKFMFEKKKKKNENKYSQEKLDRKIASKNTMFDSVVDENISPILLIPVRVALSEVIQFFSGFAKKTIIDILPLCIGAVVVERKKEFSLFRKNKSIHSSIEILKIPESKSSAVNGEMITCYVNALINEIKVSRTVSDFFLSELLEHLWRVAIECIETYLLPSPSPLLRKDQLETLDNIIKNFIKNSILSPPVAVSTNSKLTMQARAERCSRLCRLSLMTTANMIERHKQSEESVEINEEERKSIISVLGVRSNEGDKSASRFLSALKVKPKLQEMPTIQE